MLRDDLHACEDEYDKDEQKLNRKWQRIHVRLEVVHHAHAADEPRVDPDLASYLQIEERERETGWAQLSPLPG